MARKLAASTLKRFKTQLETEKVEIVEKLEKRRIEREEALANESASERVPDPATAEGGTLSVEWETERKLDAQLEQKVHDIERALERIADKSYGICTNCGEAIPVGRLEYVPESPLCVDCARR